MNSLTLLDVEESCERRVRTLTILNRVDAFGGTAVFSVFGMRVFDVISLRGPLGSQEVAVGSFNSRGRNLSDPDGGPHGQRISSVACRRNNDVKGVCMMRRIVVCLGVLLVCATTARAQEHGMAIGEAGVSFGSETGGTFGGTFGGGGAPLQGIGEVGYFTNVTPKGIQDAADLIALLVSSPGALVGVDVTAPAFYALGGVRGIVATSGAAKPYVQGGAGFARINAKLDFILNGSNINSLLIASGFVTKSDLEESGTNGLVSFGGGVQVAVGSRGVVDIGYRYYRIFTDDPAINVNRVFAGFGVRF